MTIIGLDAFGFNSFKSYSPPVREIKYFELKNAIYDELHIREQVENINTSSVKEDWQIDTYLLAEFNGDFEAGNIKNNGVKIDKFAIKRRKLNEIKSHTLTYHDFVKNEKLIYKDYTQANDEYIYSIVPIGENGLEGVEKSIQIMSDFVGFYLVDKDTDEVLSFDKYIGTAPTVDTTLNDGRVQIDTLYPYPSYYYTPQRYHTFSLNGVFLPEEWQRSGKLYESILNNFIYSRKPILVKGGTGEVYVCNVSAPSKSTPNNTWRSHDYFELTIELTEIMSYDEYINNNE